MKTIRFRSNKTRKENKTAEISLVLNASDYICMVSEGIKGNQLSLIEIGQMMSFKRNTRSIWGWFLFANTIKFNKHQSVHRMEKGFDNSLQNN